MRRLSYSEKLERIAAKLGYDQKEYEKAGYTMSLFYVGDPSTIVVFTAREGHYFNELRWYAINLSPISTECSKEEATYLLRPCASRKAFEKRLAAFVAIHAALREKR